MKKEDLKVGMWVKSPHEVPMQIVFLGKTLILAEGVDMTYSWGYDAIQDFKLYIPKKTIKLYRYTYSIFDEIVQTVWITRKWEDYTSLSKIDNVKLLKTEEKDVEIPAT